MWSKRTLPVWFLGLAAAGAVQAQSSFQLERPDFRLHVQGGAAGGSPMDRLVGHSGTQGLKVGMVGKKGPARDLGVYGRLGAASYGVGVSWDFAPRASAIVGWDSYDMRTVGGERDVRATSLGLQWRY
jgi:hypothetical protein